MAGDDRTGSAGGPDRCVQAGAAQRLAPAGVGVRVIEVVRGAPFRDTVSASLAVCGQLATAVKQAIESDELPIVLAGGCDASKGILSGFDHRGCGAVWFDAHADFNTPESTLSGYFPGMSLAVVTGHCYRRAWSRLGNAEPIPEEHVLLLGLRQIDPEEEVRLRASAIQTVPWSAGLPLGSIQAGLNRLAGRVREVYLHIDIDALDPQIAPGIVDEPVPGGLTREQLHEALRSVTEQFRVRAVALATYNPDHDRDERTLQTVLDVLQTLGSSLRQEAHGPRN
jgi:arginase